MKIKFSGILTLVLLSACHTKKSIMLRNETNHAITLVLANGQKTLFFQESAIRHYFSTPRRFLN
jgi:hypothetical protein